MVDTILKSIIEFVRNCDIPITSFSILRPW